MGCSRAFPLPHDHHHPPPHQPGLYPLRGHDEPLACCACWPPATERSTEACQAVAQCAAETRPPRAAVACWSGGGRAASVHWASGQRSVALRALVLFVKPGHPAWPVHPPGCKAKGSATGACTRPGVAASSANVVVAPARVHRSVMPMWWWHPPGWTSTIGQHRGHTRPGERYYPSGCMGPPTQVMGPGRAYLEACPAGWHSSPGWGHGHSHPGTPIHAGVPGPAPKRLPTVTRVGPRSTVNFSRDRPS